METPVSITRPTQSASQISPSLKATPPNEIMQISQQHSYPDRVGDLFRHPSPMLKRFAPDHIAAHLVAQASTSIKAIWSSDGPGIEGYRIWAEMVLEQYGDIRLVELRKIFRRAALQTNYNRIDVSVMIRWVQDYYRDREEAVAIARERYHAQLKQSHDASLRSADIKVPEAFKQRTDEMEREYLASHIGRRANKQDLKVHEPTAEQQEVLRQQREILMGMAEGEVIDDYPKDQILFEPYKMPTNYERPRIMDVLEDCKDTTS